VRVARAYLLIKKNANKKERKEKEKSKKAQSHKTARAVGSGVRTQETHTPART
jgi:hypothetical protein